MKKTKLIPFSLRFYGRTDNDIKKCLDEIIEIGISPVRYHISDTKISCNLFVPEECLPARELNLYFKTMEEADRLHQDDVREIYHKWSIKEGLQSTPVKRRKGDIAYKI